MMWMNLHSTERFCVFSKMDSLNSLVLSKVLFLLLGVLGNLGKSFKL